MAVIAAKKRLTQTLERSNADLRTVIEGRAMSKERAAGRPETRTPNRADLGQHYREIGIPAIAAALPYVGVQKNHAYAPAIPKVLTIRDLELLLG